MGVSPHEFAEELAGFRAATPCSSLILTGPGRPHVAPDHANLLFSGSIVWYHLSLNATQRKTLVDVFTDPVPRSLEWRRIESLLVASGFRAVPGRGSRVRFERDGLVGTFHRPHPAKEAKPYQVRDARHLLQSLGIEP